MLAWSILSLLTLPAALAVQYCPFLAPDTNPAPNFNGLINLDLFRRSSKCPTQCSEMNSLACCPKDTICGLDGAGNIACCPNNAACTGNLGGGEVAATAAPIAGSNAKPAGAAAATHAISGDSTVANSFYPYPYLPTTYANAAQCTASFSSCQMESAQCTGLLEGGGMAVTIAGPNGGVTQAGAMPVASAESICSSLSVEACHGLALTQCATLGGAKGAAAATFDAGMASAAPLKHPITLYGVGLSMAIGIAAQVIL